MNQQEKILRYLIRNPRGMTMRDGYLMYINSPHKRVAELEQTGVKIKRLPEKTEGGARIIRYVLADPKQERVTALLGAWEAKTKAKGATA